MKVPYRESSHRILNRHLLALLIVAVFAGFASAQSGRKQKKPEQQPPVQGVNQPDARVAPEPEAEDAPKPKNDTRPGVLISSELADLSMPMYLADIAREACIAELREARFPNVEGAKNQNRSDAIKAAKDGIYVVHLELQPSTMSSSQRVEFDLRYTLLEPKTAKVINSGAGYASQSNRVPIPQGGGLGYEQRQIELQGRDAGRKVLKFLSEREGRIP
jgi:hypothetical protein